MYPKADSKGGKHTVPISSVSLCIHVRRYKMNIWVDTGKNKDGTPRGNDKNPGTYELPLATEHEAVKRAKQRAKPGVVEFVATKKI